MILKDAQPQFLPDHWNDIVCIAVDGHHFHGKVRILRIEQFEPRRTSLSLYMDHNARIFSVVQGQELAKIHLAQDRRRYDRNGAYDLFADTAGTFYHAVVSRKVITCIAVEELSLVRKVHFSQVIIEKRQSQLFLQFLDRNAQRRLRNRKRFGCSRIAFLICNFDKINDLLDIHGSHLSIFI